MTNLIYTISKVDDEYLIDGMKFPFQMELGYTYIFKNETGKTLFVTRNDDETVQTITGIGASTYNFTASASVVFNKNIEENTYNQVLSHIVEDPSEYPLFTSSEKLKERIAVIVNGEVLTDGVDYSIDFTDNKIRFTNPITSTIKIKQNLYENTIGQGSDQIIVNLNPALGNKIFYITDLDNKISLSLYVGKRTLKTIHNNERSYPEFITINYPLFAAFIKRYLEYLSSPGNSFDFIQYFEKYNDVDSMLSSFIDKLKYEYLTDFPDTELSTSFLIKNILDFYKSRGTEQSYRFLMKALYGKSCEIINPKDDLLILSNNKYVQHNICLVADKTTATSLGISTSSFVLQTDVLNFIGKRIYSTNGLFSAFVDKIETSGDYYKLFLTNIKGTIGANTVIENESRDCFGVILEIPVDVEITDGSTGNTVGQTITYSGDGEDAVFYVSHVDVNGKIKKISILEYGIGYENNEELESEDATAIIKTGTIAKTPGYFESTQSFLSSDKKLADNWYYQFFSYVLSTEYDKEFLPTIKKISHPIGTQAFSEILKTFNYTSVSGYASLANLWTFLTSDSAYVSFGKSTEWESENTITAITKGIQTVITLGSSLTLSEGETIRLSNIAGMTELNGNSYKVYSDSTGTTVTIDVDSRFFTTYTSGGKLYKNLEDAPPSTSLSATIKSEKIYEKKILKRNLSYGIVRKDWELNKVFATNDLVLCGNRIYKVVANSGSDKTITMPTFVSKSNFVLDEITWKYMYSILDDRFLTDDIVPYDSEWLNLFSTAVTPTLIIAEILFDRNLDTVSPYRRIVLSNLPLANVSTAILKYENLEVVNRNSTQTERYLLSFAL